MQDWGSLLEAEALKVEQRLAQETDPARRIPLYQALIAFAGSSAPGWHNLAQAYTQVQDRAGEAEARLQAAFFGHQTLTLDDLDDPCARYVEQRRRALASGDWLAFIRSRESFLSQKPVPQLIPHFAYPLLQSVALRLAKEETAYLLQDLAILLPQQLSALSNSLGAQEMVDFLQAAGEEEDGHRLLLQRLQTWQTPPREARKAVRKPLELTDLDHQNWEQLRAAHPATAWIDALATTAEGIARLGDALGHQVLIDLPQRCRPLGAGWARLAFLKTAEVFHTLGDVKTLQESYEAGFGTFQWQQVRVHSGVPGVIPPELNSKRTVTTHLNYKELISAMVGGSSWFYHQLSRILPSHNVFLLCIYADILVNNNSDRLALDLLLRYLEKLSDAILLYLVQQPVARYKSILWHHFFLINWRLLSLGHLTTDLAAKWKQLANAMGEIRGCGDPTIHPHQRLEAEDLYFFVMFSLAVLQGDTRNTEASLTHFNSSADLPRRRTNVWQILQVGAGVSASPSWLSWLENQDVADDQGRFVQVQARVRLAGLEPNGRWLDKAYEGATQIPGGGYREKALALILGEAIRVRWGEAAQIRCAIHALHDPFAQVRLSLQWGKALQQQLANRLLSQIRQREENLWRQALRLDWGAVADRAATQNGDIPSATSL